MEEADLLRCLVQVIGRATIPPMEVLSVVGKRKKQIKAFNLCDGSRTLRDIARKSQINQGNLSRTTTRWLEQGILFRIGEGKAARFMHIYPVTPVKRRGIAGDKAK
jgi:hypothetical protein